MNLLSKYWQVNCEKATEMTDRSLNTSLSISDRIKLNLHVKMCEVCLRYKQQQEWIDDVLKKISYQPEDKERLEACKERILKEINNS